MWSEDMRIMHDKYGVHEWVKTATPEQLRTFMKFRLEFLQEELDETVQAFDTNDAPEIVDGLIDLCVIAIGTLDAFGVNAENAWAEVYGANMQKEVGIKESRPNPLGLPDLIKPAGWQPPFHDDNVGIIEEIYEKNDTAGSADC